MVYEWFHDKSMDDISGLGNFYLKIHNYPKFNYLNKIHHFQLLLLKNMLEKGASK